MEQANEYSIFPKILNYFKTHRWLFLAEMILIMGLSLLKYFRTPPIYESWASVLIDTSRRSAYQSVVGSAALNLRGTEQNARKTNTIVLLTSHEVMERFRNVLSEQYNTDGRPNHLRPLFPNSVALSAREFREMITLTSERNSDIFKFTCTASNSEAAHDLCVGYLKTIEAFYPEVSQREAVLKRDFLDRQTTSLIRQIKEKEQGIAEFQRKNPDFITYILESGDGEAVKTLQQTLKEAREKILQNRELRRKLLSYPKAMQGEHTVRARSIEALTAQLAELQYQMDLLEQSQDPTKPQRIEGVQTEINRISRQLGKLNEEELAVFKRSPLASGELRTRITDLEIDYQQLTLNVNSLERQITLLNARNQEFYPQRLEYDRILSELNHKKKLLANLYAKEQETDFELSAGGAEIFRLDEPTRTYQQISPVLSRHIYGGLSMSAFLIALTLLILLNLFPRLDSEIEIARLNLPVLGKIPSIRRPESGYFEEIPTFCFEFMKIIDYRIARETKDTKCPVVVITSSHSREGKSTVSQLLALSSGNIHRKTLLIDGDLITAKPISFFGIPEDSSPGIRSLIEPGNEPLQKGPVLLKTIHDGILFAPRGGRVEGSASHTYLDPVRKLIDGWRKEFDVIYIDTPPLFASNLAYQWAAFVDLIILVARLHVTRPSEILDAIQTCKIYSKAPIGIAVNGVTLSAASRRASNYYFSRTSRSKPTKLAA